jgi:hypothetical protein
VGKRSSEAKQIGIDWTRSESPWARMIRLDLERFAVTYDLANPPVANDVEAVRPSHPPLPELRHDWHGLTLYPLRVYESVVWDWIGCGKAHGWMLFQWMLADDRVMGRANQGTKTDCMAILRGLMASGIIIRGDVAAAGTWDQHEDGHLERGFGFIRKLVRNGHGVSPLHYVYSIGAAP